MTASMIATRRLRATLLAVAGVSVAFTSGAIANLNPFACLSKPSHPVAQQTTQARQIGRPGPGLLGIVRQIASAELTITRSAATPQPIDPEPKADRGQLTDRALRERITRYQVAPTPVQRHTSLAIETQPLCSD